MSEFNSIVDSPRITRRRPALGLFSPHSPGSRRQCSLIKQGTSRYLGRKTAIQASTNRRNPLDGIYCRPTSVY